MAAKNLTSYLTTLQGKTLYQATAHPFLSQAGAGTLAPGSLCKWLVQDKYYQFAYVNFIGRLISKLDLTTYAFPDKDQGDNLEWKTLNTLITALQAIKGEIDFYNETVEKYGLELEKAGEDETTKKYRELFEESSAAGKPVVWGLTVLWATEFIYFKAWSHAKQQQDDSKPVGDEKGAVAALHKEFIPNWTSDDFRGAVSALAEAADAWEAGPENGERSNCEKLWERVLELETKFWPDV